MQSYEIFPKKLARSRNMSYLCIAIETETVLKTKNLLRYYKFRTQFPEGWVSG